MIVVLLLVFSGCASKPTVLETVVVKKELICIKQHILAVPHADIKIQNIKGNIELAKSYKQAVEQGFKTYEKQIRTNNQLCVSPVRDNNHKSDNEK